MVFDFPILLLDIIWHFTDIMINMKQLNFVQVWIKVTFSRPLLLLGENLGDGENWFDYITTKHSYINFTAAAAGDLENEVISQQRMFCWKILISCNPFRHSSCSLLHALSMIPVLEYIFQNVTLHPPRREEGKLKQRNLLQNILFTANL